MAVKTNAELDAYFNTGDQPSESNFKDIIDTIQPKSETLAETTGGVSLTVADHAFRNIFVGDLTGTLTLTMPTTWTAEYDWWHIIWMGTLSGDDGNNLKIASGTQGSHFFKGHFASYDDDGDAVSISHGDGATHDNILATSMTFAEIWIQAHTSTTFYAWGHGLHTGNSNVLTFETS